MEKQEIRDIAIAEIIFPTFALTKQFLAVNKIVFKENLPFIEDIILKEEGKIAEVYFPIEGEGNRRGRRQVASSNQIIVTV